MIIYYKVIEVWCNYPFKDVIDYRYVIFSTSKRKFEKQKLDFKMDSNTSLKEKKTEVEQFLGRKITKIEKLT